MQNLKYIQDGSKIGLIELEKVYGAVKEINSVLKTNSEYLTRLHEDLCIQIIKATEPLREYQKQWINDVREIQKRYGVDLFIVKGNAIFYNNIEIIAKNKKTAAQSFLLLKILLCHSDKKGFVSYKNIEEYFIKYGLTAKKTEKSSHERIRNAKKDIFRFLKIPEKYGDIEIIETVRGKGLKLNNPRVLY